jgi:hypothetical protein
VPFDVLPPFTAGFVLPTVSHLSDMLLPRKSEIFKNCVRVYSSVVDPDLYVFGPPGSGSVIIARIQVFPLLSKKIRKTLYFYWFVTSL